jgi:hypothetical protein
LALNGGEPRPGIEILREYRVDGAGLCVTETDVRGDLEPSQDYHLPARARAIRLEADRVSYRLGGSASEF